MELWEKTQFQGENAKTNLQVSELLMLISVRNDDKEAVVGYTSTRQMELQ